MKLIFYVYLALAVITAIKADVKHLGYSYPKPKFTFQKVEEHFIEPKKPIVVLQDETGINLENDQNTDSDKAVQDPSPLSPFGGNYGGYQNYPQAFPGQGFPNSGFPNGGLPNLGFPNSGLINAGFPNAGFPNAGFPNAGFPNAGIPNGGYPGGAFPNTGFPNPGFPTTGFPNAGLPNAGFANPGLPNAGFANPGLPNAGFPNTGVPNIGFPNAGFPNSGAGFIGGPSFYPGNGFGQQPGGFFPRTSSRLVASDTAYGSNGGYVYEKP
ncbi:uncharacterized PPE family protein PPE62 [Teleopsis dalmanni]|uniref:uncharacterized PPE family protein PPE62 n=1 Tax=Teleopsis dalmanni TaxID=139649 RepID=UPI0018CE40B7|nr:uncharacterized PPE family protein PPE62 [Teleopsis dalmanni]